MKWDGCSYIIHYSSVLVILRSSSQFLSLSTFDFPGHDQYPFAMARSLALSVIHNQVSHKCTCCLASLSLSPLLLLSPTFTSSPCFHSTFTLISKQASTYGLILLAHGCRVSNQNKNSTISQLFDTVKCPKNQKVFRANIYELQGHDSVSGGIHTSVIQNDTQLFKLICWTSRM